MPRSLALVVGLAIYNVVRSAVIDGNVDIVTNLVVGATVFVVGRRAGLSLTELGLDRGRIRPRLRLGLLTAVVVIVVVTVGAAALAASDESTTPVSRSHSRRCCCASLWSSLWPRPWSRR